MKAYPKLALFMILGLTHPTVGYSQKSIVVEHGISKAAGFIKGTPMLTSYGIEDFQSDPKMMTMCEDSMGIKYFGNQDGVLVFDGEKWHSITLPNKSLVKSTYYSSDGKVYVGGFNEFGTIEVDGFGQYFFHSMLDILPPDQRKLEFVLGIHEVQGHMIFRSMTKLVAMTENSTFVIPTSGFYFSTVVSDELYLANWSEGIQKLNLQTKNFENIISPREYNWQPIVGILSGNEQGQLSIIERSGLMYTYDQQNDEFTLLMELFDKGSPDQILCVSTFRSGDVYIGTLANQMIVLHKSGEIQPINRSIIALQDKSVNGIYECKNGNIWILLDNGIDCVDLNSPVSILFDKASVFDVIIFDQRIYIATNQGVWVSAYTPTDQAINHFQFNRIKGLDGQAWSFQLIENQLLCGHEKGLFVLNGENAQQISGTDGVWKVVPIPNASSHYLVCTYYGIYHMTFDSIGFRITNFLEGFGESSRDILSDDNGYFWICHGFKGVFKIKIAPDFKRILSQEHFEKNGLPSPYKINVFRWNDDVIFTTSNGVYFYKEQDQIFERHPLLNELFDPNYPLRKINQYQNQIWYVYNDQVGYLDDTLKAIPSNGLFLQTKGKFNKDMESILPLEKGVLIGTKIGLYAFDLSVNVPEKANHRVRLTGVSYNSGDVRTNLMLDSDQDIDVDKIEDLRFDYAVPQMDISSEILYSYFMDGVDDHWSEWSTQSWKEYSSLESGAYTFSVKAKSLLGESFKEAEINIQFQNRWYQAWWLWLCLIIILFLIFTVKKWRIVVAKRSLLEINEPAIHMHDKLEEGQKYSLNEMTHYTSSLLRNRGLLFDIKDGLAQLEEYSKNEKVRYGLKKMSRKISLHLNDEEYFKDFDVNFKMAYPDFYDQLKAQYAEISLRDMRLCALIKMNLTNKEIAPIMNLSVRGIESARYRLRKRIDLI